MKPECEKGIWHYRPGKEYIILKKLHGPESHTTGVYLCQDKHTKATFIMKRVSWHLISWVSHGDLLSVRICWIVVFLVLLQPRVIFATYRLAKATPAKVFGRYVLNQGTSFKLRIITILCPYVYRSSCVLSLCHSLPFTLAI